ncbi:hypothetical protein GCM10010129_60150 [Streptomyces fumigatiscleroticus]|nr:hypothetical protein GCM10010129_60150 [Streptomyces fumigatiscleroticus]
MTTGACSRIGDRWGTASLLNSGQTTFAQGRQLPLSGTAAGQSATWPYVGAGTYTVVVMCSNGNTAGTQSVIVSPAAAPSRAASRAPTISATASPSRGVMGGLGGTARDYGTVTLVAGGALVGAGTVGAAWYLRSRTRPRRY